MTDSQEPLRVLHLFGDWKWTGPAEPVVDLCAELRQRGCDVRLACSAPPAEANRNIVHEAAAREVPTITDFSLRRLSAPMATMGDVIRVSQFIDQNAVEIVHTHFTHDHVVGLLAAKYSQRRPRLVRSNHTGLPVRSGVFKRILYGEGADAVLTFSARACRQDCESGLNHPKTRWVQVDPAMKLDRFRVSKDSQVIRAAYSIGPEDVIFGVVARMQRHRRFDVLLKGFALALKQRPNVKLMIVGRGTHWEEVAKVPAQNLGIEKSVIFTGYVSDTYLDVVNVFDAAIFLVPGSDGTCRALREAMAMGKPAIGAHRGMIPEIIDEGQTGFVVDDTPENLARAMVRLSDDATLRRFMGEQGRRQAFARYRIEDQAMKVLELYQSLRK